MELEAKWAVGGGEVVAGGGPGEFGFILQKSTKENKTKQTKQKKK